MHKRDQSLRHLTDQDLSKAREIGNRLRDAYFNQVLLREWDQFEQRTQKSINAVRGRFMVEDTHKDKKRLLDEIIEVVKSAGQGLDLNDEASLALSKLVSLVGSIE